MFAPIRSLFGPRERRGCQMFVGNLVMLRIGETVKFLSRRATDFAEMNYIFFVCLDC